MSSLSSAYVHGSLSSAAAESGRGRGGTAESGRDLTKTRYLASLGSYNCLCNADTDDHCRL